MGPIGRYHGQASGTPSKAAAAEGCEVLRPTKAAAEVLRLLRPARNVPYNSFEAQEKQLVGPREVPWPSKRDAFESCAAEGCEVLRPSKAAAELLKLLRLDQNVPHSSFEAQEVPWPSKPDAFESCAAEGCEVLRPSKAAAELLTLLRPAQDMPHNSFEAQEKQLVGPREVPWPSKRDAFESCAAEGCEVLRPSKAAAELLKLLNAFKACPKHAT